ncbi:MAG TPA: type II toxin-antitoxin system VapC family toxin [Gemmatimonadaceae bacterium]
MRLLLDTHVFLWWRAGREMRAEAMDAIRTADDVFVSAASAWEVSIKAAIGKLRLTASFADGVAQSGFVPLPINLHHAAVAGELPPHHRDPFDRMLLAQARLERLTLISHDRRLEPYGSAIIWA